MNQFGVVHNFRLFRFGKPFFHCREGLVFHVVCGNFRRAWFRRHFNSQHSRAKSLLVRIIGIERKPNGCGLFRRQRIEKLFELRGRIERRVFRLASHR